MTSVAKTVPSTPWERRMKYIGCIVQHEVSKRFREAVKPRRAKARKNENGNQSRQSLNHPLAQLCSQLSRLLYTPCLPDKKHRYPPPCGNRIFQCFVAPPTALLRFPFARKYLSRHWKFILRQCLKEEETQAFHFERILLFLKEVNTLAILHKCFLFNSSLIQMIFLFLKVSNNE